MNINILNLFLGFIHQYKHRLILCSCRTLTHVGQAAAAARHQHPRAPRVERASSVVQSVRRRRPPRAHVYTQQWLPPTRSQPPRPQTAVPRAVLVLDVFFHRNSNYKFLKLTDETLNVAVTNVLLPGSLAYIAAKSKSGYKQNPLCERRF